jgi:hypothetical protein
MQVGQATHTCDSGKEKAVLGRSGAAGCFAAWPARARCGDATPPDGSRPPGSSGARWRDLSGRADPRGILRIRRGPVAPSSRSDLGRKTGCTRVRPGLRLLSRCCAACPPSIHGSTPPALSRTKPMGASGQDRWRQRPCLRTRQRSKALRPAAASGVGAAVRTARRPAAAIVTARRYRPSVTTGRLLTRETLRRVGHDRGRT